MIGCWVPQQSQDPINGRFIGLIDDLRFYRSLRAEELARETFNKGLGDLSLSIDTDFPASTHDNPITANLLFKKYGEEYELSDFNSSRIILTNGDLLGFSGSGANWTIEFNSTIDPGRVGISLLEGVGIDISGQESLPTSFEIGFARPLTRVENLTAWWSFDEGSGTTATDYMSGSIGQFVSGDSGFSNVSFDTVNAKFGSALRFPKMHGFQPTL